MRRALGWIMIALCGLALPRVAQAQDLPDPSELQLPEPELGAERSKGSGFEIAPEEEPPQGAEEPEEASDPDKEEAEAVPPEPNQGAGDEAVAATTQDPGEERRRRRRDIVNGLYVLFFYEHDPADMETFAHVLGLYWYRDKPDWQLHLVAPLGAYWKWKDDPDHWGLATPLFWHSTGAEHSYTSAALLYHRWRSPQTRFDALAPLYWHHHDLIEDDNLHILGPAYWRQRQATTSWGLLPLIWGSSGAESSSLTVLPLFSWESDPSGWELYSLAFFTTKDEVTGEKTGGIPPLLTFWSSSEESETLWQLPLLVHHKTQRGTLNLVPALLMGGWEEEEYSLGIQLPLYVGYTNHRSGKAFRLLLPLLYARYSEPRDAFDFGMMGPIYGWSDHEDYGFGIWPLLQITEEEDGDSSTLLFPLYYALNQGEDQHRWFLPLLYERSQWADGDALAITGPIYDWRSGDFRMRGLLGLAHVEENSYFQDELTLTPLYGSYETPTRATRVLWPLLSLHHLDEAADEELIIAGPAYWSSQGESLFAGVAPLYFHGEDPAANVLWDVVPGLWTRLWLPDFSFEHLGTAWRYEDAEIEHAGLAPLAAWRRDKASGDLEIAVAPAFYLATGEDRFQLHVGPAWWDERDGTVSGGVLPFFGRYEGANGVTTTLVAPLLLESHNEETGDWWAVGAPGFYLQGNRERGERLIMAPPFFMAETPSEQGWMLFPLGFGHTNAAHDLWALLPLALGYSNLEEGSHLTLGAAGLFGRYTHEGDGVDSGWLGPLVWSDAPTRRFRMLLPLLVDWADLETGTELFTMLPLYWRWRSASEEGVRRSLDALAPLFVRYSAVGPDGQEEGFTTAGPAFWYDGALGSGGGLAPLVWWDRETLPDGQQRGHEVVLPLWLRWFDESLGESSLIAGPLYSFTTPEEESYGLLPIFAGHTEQTPYGEAGWSALAPLFFHNYGFNASGERTELLLTPVGFKHQEGDSEIALLLNLYHAKEGDEETDVVFPLVYRSQSPSHSTLGIAPLFWSHEEADGELLRVVLPFYLQWADPAGASFVAGGPIWYAEDGHGGYDTGLFPLIWWGEESDGVDGYSSLLPLWWYSREGEERTLLTPLYMQQWSPERRWLLGPGFYHESDDAEETSLTVIGPWLNLRAPGRHGVGVLPFYFGWHERTNSVDTILGLAWWWDDEETQEAGAIVGPAYYLEDREGTSAGLFPLVHVREEYDGSKMGWVAPLAFWKTRPNGSSTWIAGPVFSAYDADDESSLWGVAPLAWAYESPGRSGSAVLPFYGYQSRPDGHTFLSPLFYSYREGDTFQRVAGPYIGWGDEASSWHIALPLYFGSRHDDGSSFDLLLPLYVHNQSAGDRQGWTAAPLYFHSYDRDADEHARVVFPLYWDLRNAKRDLTVVGPWWRSERLDVKRTSHGLVPFYYYTEDPTGYSFELLGGIFSLDHDARSQTDDYRLLWIPL